MKMRSLIGRLQSPNFRKVAEIIQAHDGLVLTHHKTIRFPTGSVQLWAFGPYRYRRQPTVPPVAESVVVAVHFRDQQIESWKTLDQSFDQALAHYRHQAALREPAPARALPELPPGVRAVIPEIGTTRRRPTGGGP